VARKLRRPRYNPAYFLQLQNDPKLYSSPIRVVGFKGHDKVSAISRLGEGYCRLVRNLMFRDGQYFTRDGVQDYGDISGGSPVHAQEVVLSNGSVHVLKFCVDNVWLGEGGAWIASAGVPWTTSDLRAFSITGWADTVVFAEDNNGIYQLDFSGVYTKTLLVSLIGVHHLATFAGRIIASLDNKVQWCVKNNQTDWTGLGSGYEDLKSAVGGRPDGQTAVIPISDDTALVLRTSSVWIMRTTGNFDAPFSFTLFDNGKGCRWPRTVQAISGGAIWLGDDGVVWMYSPNQYGQGIISNISQAIYKSLQQPNSALRVASSMYDPRYDEYRLTIPDGSNVSTVHRFNRQAGWTEDVYQFPIRSMSFALYGMPTTIDQLVGTIDSLVGAIDDLTNIQPATKAMFTMRMFGSKYVTIEYKPAVGPIDVDYLGLPTAGTMRLETAYVQAADPLHRTETLQLITEYEATAACNLSYYYSDDGGVTWNLLFTVPIAATTKPVQMALDYPLDRDSIQFAVSSADMVAMHLIDFFVMARQGGMKIDEA
jgi:hypothetical protein